MMYLVATLNKDDRYHHSYDGQQPYCRSNADWKQIDESDTDGLTLCEHCAAGRNYHAVYDDKTITEKMLDAVETEWKTPNELAEELEPSGSVMRRRLNELHQAGKLNRRGGLRDTDGSKGYEYSQLETPKADYEENNNLFESMLNGD
jgi:predicted transcriptional regulator